jgi:tetratricopeptide (TPR) repeat protein
MTDTAAADLVRAESLATQALAAAPRSSLAHYANGDVLRAKRRYAEAIAEYEMALSVQSQRGVVITLPCLLQVLHRVDRGSDLT